MVSHTRPSRFSVCNIEKLGRGQGTRLLWACLMYWVAHVLQYFCYIQCFMQVISTIVERGTCSWLLFYTVPMTRTRSRNDKDMRMDVDRGQCVCHSIVGLLNGSCCSPVSLFHVLLCFLPHSVICAID